MRFDKSKVYTMLNADEAPIGSCGYFANTVYRLRYVVENETNENYGPLERVEDDFCFNRFNNGEPYSYNLFYLVEENA